jgi:hypothetical protein
MLFWAVVSDSIEGAVEHFTSREEAEAIVQAWDRDEPEQAGALRVEKIEFRTGTANWRDGFERPCETLVAWAREA